MKATTVNESQAKNGAVELLNKASLKQAAAAAKPRLRVLILEDNPADAELMVNALRQGGLDPQWERVQTEEDFAARLTSDLDLILSDYALPQFNGVQALKLVRSRGLDVPFILISGSIGEDVAVEAMRSGADDYLLKDRMARLAPAIRQALEQAQRRREQTRAESALQASEERLRLFVEHAPAAIAMLDNEMRYIAVSRRWLTDYRLGAQDLTGRNHYEVFPEIPDRWKEIHRRCLAGAIEKCEEDPFPRADGSLDWIRWEIHPWRRDGGEIAGIVLFSELITERKLQQQKIERLSRIRALSGGINGAIVRAGSRQQLLDDTCRIAVEHGGFGIAWIGKLDPSTLDVMPVAWAGVGPEQFTRKTTARDNVSAGQGAIGRALRERKPVFVNDITRNTAVGGQRREEAIRRGYRSLIALPLFTSGDVFGNLTLITKELNFFDDEEATLLAELAGNISFALESIARQEKIERLSRIRDVTSEINAAIIHAGDQQSLFEDACRIAVEQGRLGCAWIGTLDPATQDVTPVAWAGEGAERVTRGTSSALDDTPRGQGPVGRAIRARHPVFNNDITARTLGGPRVKEIVQLGFRSQLTLPLFENQTVAGTLTLCAAEANFFDEEELRLLTELAGDISFALANISRQQKLDKLARIRAVSSEINAAIIRIHERAALLRETCRIVVEHGKFDLVWIALLDREKQRIEPVAWSGFSSETAHNLSWGNLSTPGGALAEIMRTRKVTVLNDLDTAAPAGKLRLEAIEKGYRSTVCMPFMVDATVVAAMSLFAPGRDFFDEEELALLNEVAGNISFALEHIGKEEKIARLIRIQAVMSGINAAIVHIRERQELFNEACRVAMEHGKFETAWIGVFDAAAQEVVAVARAGAPPDLAVVPKRIDVSKSQGMVSRAMRKKLPEYDNDITAPSSSGGERRALAIALGFRSMVALPFVVEGAVAGHLSLYTKEPDFFNEDETKLLTDLAGDISFALEHIGKEEKIARLSRIQAVMSGINYAIVHVRDRQDLFNETCRIAVEHGNFGIAWIGALDPQTLDVTPVASTGPGAQAFVDGFKCSADSDDPAGNGIVGQAIRARKPVFLNNGLHEPGRRNVAVKLGYHSRIALPLLAANEVVGIIVLFAREPDFFTAEEIGLLTELAGNISFALDHIRKGEALTESEHKLDSILSTLQEVVWSMDPRTGRMLYVNAAISQLTRRPAADFIAQPRLWRSMIHRDDRAAVRNGIRRLLQEGALVHEFRIVLAGGEERTVESSARVRHDDAGKAARIDGTISDITERKQAETALRRLNDELEDKVAARTLDLQRAQHEAEVANHAKSSFLAAMSHEIRTPMNGVVGMIDVLHQSNLKGDQVEMVELIRESAFSLLGIINDILDFSKIEAGKLELEREAIAVADVVESVCSLLNGMAEKKNVALTLYTDPAIPGEVLGDALRLRQVLINLANNAVKFCSGQPRAGRVAVRASLVEQSVERVTVDFRITDNGIGMDDETQARLFSAFTQADVSTTRRFGGTGLGLAIANHLVELMDGKITVQSAPDAGSAFNIRLPFAPLPVKAQTAQTAPDVAGLSCMVIGGPSGLANDFAVYLRHAGAFVERAADLADARSRTPSWRGLSVWVVDAGDAPQPPEEIRAAARAFADQDVRFVVVLIERGKRRWPRAVAPDMITVDGNVLNRQTFLKAVAVAAGRAPLEVETEKEAPDKLSMIAPTREEALRQGRLILIAEDNETNQKVIGRQLALLGYTADVAPDGRAALERWRSGDYALLLTDLHMPRMDGYELAQAIRVEEKGTRRIPIIALTANALKSEAERCRAVGMDDYRTKPSPLAELKAVLAQWLPVARAPADASASPKPSPAAPQQPATAVPVNISVLQDLVGDDPQFIREFLQDFRASAAAITLEMRTACVKGRPRAAAAAAHKLKSSARAVGALALGELCAAMEEKGKAGDRDALAVLLPRFETEMLAVDHYLSLPQEHAPRRRINDR